MTTHIQARAFNFQLPELLECALPTEVRGLPRDGVRLMVSRRADNKIFHSRFNKFDAWLRAGDVLVVNTSATMKAALPTLLPNGKTGRIHLSVDLNNQEWLVEIREIRGNKTKRFASLHPGQLLDLPGGGKVELIAPFYQSKVKGHIQLWKARFFLREGMEQYLDHHGLPIRYSGIDQVYPIEYYQTVFSNEPGSAEMPSAGRAFTPDLITRLVSKGIQFAPLVLHTGVSSLEVGEAPYPEYFKVPATTAQVVNQAKSDGRRIIAVGTTAIRAIESAANDQGQVLPAKGMTDLYITPERGLNVVNALLTGFHEPRASHLLMMEALASRQHLNRAYQMAIKEGYHWHEFGDLHLLF